MTNPYNQQLEAENRALRKTLGQVAAGVSDALSAADEIGKWPVNEAKTRILFSALVEARQAIDAMLEENAKTLNGPECFIIECNDRRVHGGQLCERHERIGKL